MSNIKKQNEIRINLSSFSTICKLKKIIKFDSKLKKIIKFDSKLNKHINLNNKKIININNFELKINNKKVNYSTYYTNPYIISQKLVNNIKFKKTKNNLIIKLCNKIFLLTSNNILETVNAAELNILLLKKKKFINKYISIEQSLLILWYIIYLDEFIKLNDKQIYFDLIKYYYNQYILDIFDFNKIIQGVINSLNVLHKKFYISFYILAEEFHFKYINKILEINKNSNIIFNSNYIKINPQTLLNDFNNEITYDLNSIDEEISNPYGHNILLIKSNKNKIYYYDPDEQIQSDLYKLKILFNSISINFFNISNRTPIQTITDDSNCVFYCIGFIKYLIQNNIELELNKLKLTTLLYESFLLSININIFKWTIK